MFFHKLQQAELQKQQAMLAQRLLRAQALAQGEAHGHSHAAGHAPRREHTTRRRATCTVRVNNLHAAEAIETDVWLSGQWLPAHTARSSSVILTYI